MIDAHRAAEGIDLADDLTLGHPADRRVAAHLADGIAVDRQQRGAQAHPGRCQGGLEPGVTRTDDDHIIMIGIAPRCPHTSPSRSGLPNPFVLALIPASASPHFDHTGIVPADEVASSDRDFDGLAIGAGGSLLLSLENGATGRGVLMPVLSRRCDWDRPKVGQFPVAEVDASTARFKGRSDFSRTKIDQEDGLRSD